LSKSQKKISTSLNQNHSSLSYVYQAILILIVGSLVTVGLIWLIIGESIIGLEEDLLIFFRHSSDLANPLGSTAIEEAIRNLTALGGTLVTTLLTTYVVVLLFTQVRDVLGNCGLAGGGLCVPDQVGFRPSAP
jgi:hypothetical protein